MNVVILLETQMNLRNPIQSMIDWLCIQLGKMNSSINQLKYLKLVTDLS